MNNIIELNSIFEHSNARYYSSQQLANEFVWTYSFERLLSNKNHIVLGSRGSGKTALIKMLSHEYLSKLDHPQAKSIIDSNSFIATYIPLKVEWVNSIKSVSQDDDLLFTWCLNLSSCARFIDTIKSLIKTNIQENIDRVLTEESISVLISEIWLDKSLDTLAKISQELEKIEYKKNIYFNKVKLGISLNETDLTVGENFNADLFKPLHMAIRIVQEKLNISERSVWCVCIDEAEFLTKEHHKILNTYMRSYGDIVFKITTMPYRHYTLETKVGNPVNIGHDFDYLYIDKLGLNTRSQKSYQPFFESFAENLFQNRIKGSRLDKDGITLKSLLGSSELIEPTKEFDKDTEVEAYIRRYCDDKTIERAETLIKSDHELYQSSILRKIKGTLLLRHAYEKYIGNTAPSIYSGSSLVIRCSDGNPRRLLRLFNYLLSDKLQGQGSIDFIPQKEQGNRIKEFSYSELDGLNLEVDGKEAFELFNRIGRFFKDKLHSDKIGTNTYNSFVFDSNQDDWKHIEKAVDLGLIYPDFRGIDNSDKMPNRNGKFSLAFCLAPYFFLMPRKGDSISLSTIEKYGTYSKYLRLNRNKENFTNQYSLDLGDEDE
ncbi:ORC-CDC6 family AAA ATPase [Vibrio owensii]|uniref:ORC-CDC6 family AAA ATPase n=1 Tax=Vibrio owensii TaxID=696485 RepID=UPI0040686DC1